jgi:short-subunit dehydrogenase
MSKVVLITGASSGIGKSIAEYLFQKGMVVYGTSRNPQDEAVNGVKMLALDVTEPQTIEKAVNTILSAENRLDVLINNAGMGITGPIEDTPTQEMRNVFNTNLFGAIDMIKEVLPQMRTQQSGLIINVTSIAGYMGLPFRGMYSATKGALEIVTEAIRMEVKNFNIEVTNIAPGDFVTNIAAGRYHTPVYESSAYKEQYAKNLALMDADVNDGLSPEVMAKFVFKIIQTSKPKIHYRVGSFMQKFSIVLKRILPDKVYERLLMNHYKL